MRIKCLPRLRPNGAKYFRRREASRVRDFQFALAISSVREAGKNVLFREEWQFPQNVGVAHPAGQIVQHVVHGDSQPANARLAASLAWFHGDDIRVPHASTLFQKPPQDNQKRRFDRRPDARYRSSGRGHQGRGGAGCCRRRDRKTRRPFSLLERQSFWIDRQWLDQALTGPTTINQLRPNRMVKRFTRA